MIENKRFILEEFGLNFIVNDNGRNLTGKRFKIIDGEIKDTQEIELINYSEIFNELYRLRNRIRRI